MSAKGQHTPLATVRRDLNAEFTALARITMQNLLQDRQAIVELTAEVQRIRHREWIWAGAVGVLTVCAMLQSFK